MATPSAKSSATYSPAAIMLWSVGFILLVAGIWFLLATDFHRLWSSYVSGDLIGDSNRIGLSKVGTYNLTVSAERETMPASLYDEDGSRLKLTTVILDRKTPYYIRYNGGPAHDGFEEKVPSLEEQERTGWKSKNPYMGRAVSFTLILDGGYKPVKINCILSKAKETDTDD